MLYEFEVTIETVKKVVIGAESSNHAWSEVEATYPEFKQIEALFEED